MKLIAFIALLFKRQDTYASLFSSALTEGIKDVFKEMGNRTEKRVGKGENNS
jgi:hypothetical protein